MVNKIFKGKDNTTVSKSAHKIKLKRALTKQ